MVCAGALVGFVRVFALRLKAVVYALIFLPVARHIHHVKVCSAQVTERENCVAFVEIVGVDDAGQLRHANVERGGDAGDCAQGGVGFSAFDAAHVARVHKAHVGKFALAHAQLLSQLSHSGAKFFINGSVGFSHSSTFIATPSLSQEVISPGQINPAYFPWSERQKLRFGVKNILFLGFCTKTLRRIKWVVATNAACVRIQKSRFWCDTPGLQMWKNNFHFLQPVDNSPKAAYFGGKLSTGPP